MANGNDGGETDGNTKLRSLNGDKFLNASIPSTRFGVRERERALKCYALRPDSLLPLPLHTHRESGLQLYAALDSVRLEIS
jgi:hypothetical protein